MAKRAGMNRVGAQMPVADDKEKGITSSGSSIPGTTTAHDGHCGKVPQRASPIRSRVRSTAYGRPAETTSKFAGFFYKKCATQTNFELNAGNKMYNSIPEASRSAKNRGFGPYLLGPERRCGISDIELAAAMLSHAVAYLINEQLAGRRSPIQANRDAIQILCQAGEALALTERREPGRRFIAEWISKSRRKLAISRT